MKVFIAGGSGAIGLPLVQALIARKGQVTGLTRSAEKRRTLEQLGAAAAVANALDAADLEQAVLAAPPFSIPLWLLRLMSPFLATVFETLLAISNRKAKDELDWRLQYPSYREGLREVAAHV